MDGKAIVLIDWWWAGDTHRRREFSLHCICAACSCEVKHKEAVLHTRAATDFSSRVLGGNCQYPADMRESLHEQILALKRLPSTRW